MRNAILILITLTSAATRAADAQPGKESESRSALVLALQQPGTLQARIRFDHITSADGLSNDSVFAVLEDRQGFMWFGTQAGLNRYDGYRVTQYRFDPQNSKSLGEDFIHYLFEDSRGFIGSGNGVLSRF